jgi:Domain of unknown function (DUF397)
MRPEPASPQDLTWRAARRCAGGECVEVADHAGMIAVRSSTAGELVVWFTRDEWDAFLAGVHAGELDDLDEIGPTGSALS